MFDFLVSPTCREYLFTAMNGITNISDMPQISDLLALLSG